MSRREGTPMAVIGAFALTVLCSVGFAVAYCLGLDTQAMGGALGGAFVFLSLGLALWSRRIDKGEAEYVEERALGPSPLVEYNAFHDALVDQPVPRSRVLWAMLGLAATSIGGAALFPLRSLFPHPSMMSAESPDQQLAHTEWKHGDVLVTEEGRPVSPDDLETGSILTVFPFGADPRLEFDTTTVLVRVDPTDLHLPQDALSVTVDGIVAYSKLCTHAGCPVGLYADTYHQLLCPCHHSIFDVLTGATPIEGPAARPLPQLPISTNGDGFLIALGDFSAPVGPGWWGYPT